MISPKAQDAFYSRHQNNFIRLDKGKDEPDDNEQSNKYTRAAKDFNQWCNDGVLQRESMPEIYIYEQIFKIEGKEYSRKGFLANIKLEELRTGHIFPHEQTLSRPKADRFNLMSACFANFSPVFFLYPEDENEELSATMILDANSTQGPDVSFTDDEGVKNVLWVVTDTNVIENLTKVMRSKPLFIADGHHRYETSLKYRTQ